jgi:hypothetical protein
MFRPDFMVVAGTTAGGVMKAFAIRYLFAGILVFPLSSALAADSIKVAFVGSLSGPFALQGDDTMKNIGAAADLVNSRGSVFALRQLCDQRQERNAAVAGPVEARRY